MASSSYRHHFESSTPHFFKIILRDSLTQSKLDIPKNFVRKHGEALETEVVRLKVASGAEWKVGLTKSYEKVWFGKGWEEFVKFYRIKIGHFLTFRYEGNFCFHVIIFDRTASEIEYPLPFEEFHEKKVFDGEVRKREREEFEDNNVTQTLHSLADKRMRTSDEACAKNGVCRTSDFKKVELPRKEDLHPSVLKSDLKPHKERNPESYSRKQPSTANQRAGISEKASKFKSLTMNPSFMVTIGLSYLHTGKCNVNIPKEFANAHLKKPKEMILQVSDGRVWKILCVERWYHGKKRVEMGGGWKAFARDNSLKKGDICIFELMESTKTSFKATIVRLIS